MEITYMDQIDKGKTIAYMKKHLAFLKQYSASKRLEGYESEPIHTQQVEDGAIDYLQYTRSVIQVSSSVQVDQSGRKLLDAIQRKDEENKIRREEAEQRDKLAYRFLQGIALLEKMECELLQDIYVRGLERKVVLARHGYIVESTLNRRLAKAYVNLAIILHMEILV